MQQLNHSSGEEQVTVRKDGKVFLQRPGFSQGRRCIGWVEGDCFHTERDPERHLLKVLKAYGFNYGLIRSGDFQRIAVHTPTGVLETTREAVLQFGKFLHFAKRGFERQIFLRLDDFGRAPEQVLPKPLAVQMSLFEAA